MKNLIFVLAFAAITLAACNNSKSSDSQSGSKISQTNQVTASANSETKNTSPITEIVGQYLQIKNGLANDNGKDAANAANALVASIDKIINTSFTVDQKKIWTNIAPDAKEMSEHIGKNANKLEHQREHFDMLSKDMYDLVKAFGSGQVLYKIFDQMYNNGKGAFWLSETKEIKNPYMGKAMSNSGTIKEEIK